MCLWNRSPQKPILVIRTLICGEGMHAEQLMSENQRKLGEKADRLLHSKKNIYSITRIMSLKPFGMRLTLVHCFTAVGEVPSVYKHVFTDRQQSCVKTSPPN